MKDLKPASIADKEIVYDDDVYFSDSKLYPIAQKAKSKSQEKFSNLFHHVTEERVISALAKIERKSAAGPDGINRDMATVHLDWLLPKHLDAVHKRKYEAPPSRRVFIPKSNGAKRPLSIGNIVDRGIQGALREVLEHIYEQDFLDSSFGFRPKRSAHNALATFNHGVRNEGLKYFLEVDLENFFGTINHKWLMEFLSHRIADQRVLTVIKSWLKAGVIEEGKVLKNEVGAAQGGAISPLLANIYLHYVLDLWFDKKIKPRVTGRCRLIRYADDFVAGFENEDDCLEFKTLLEARLEQFKLKINESKTHITTLGPPSGATEPRRRHVSLLGFKIFLSKTNKGYGTKLVYKTDGKKITQSLTSIKEKLWKMMHLPVELQARYLNSVLRGHFNYFGLAGNGKALDKFRHLLICTWRRTLSRRSQVGNITWDKMTKMITKLGIITPKLKIPYHELSSYVVV